MRSEQQGEGKTVALKRIVLRQLGLFFACILVIEGLLWIVFPVSLVPPTPNDTFLQNIPGLRKKVVYRENSCEFRSATMEGPAKPDGTIRVLCIGASTTAQPTQNTEDSWCGILGEKLNERFPDTGLQIETASFGRGGWRVIDLLLWARKNLAACRPDVVLILMGINDLAWHGGPKYRYESLEARIAEKKSAIDRAKKLAAARDRSFKSLCKKYSQLCRRLVIAKRRIRQRRDAKSGRILEWHSRRLPELREQRRQYRYVEDLIRDPDPIHEFRDAMDALILLIKEMSAEAVVLGQPVLWKESMEPDEVNVLWFYVDTTNGPVRPSGRWLAKEMARYNEAQRNTAEVRGVPYVDLDARIPKTLDYYFDDCHYTDRGSRAVALAVLPALTETVKGVVLRRSPATNNE